MSSPGKYIAAGVFIGLLMFKPSFGIVLGRTIGELSTAAFENQQPQVQAQPVVEALPNRPDPSEDREAIFSAIERIIDRLEHLEFIQKNKDAEADAEQELPRFSDKEDPTEESKALPRREATNSSDLMNPKQFDQEFNKKFNISRVSQF